MAHKYPVEFHVVKEESVNFEQNSAGEPTEFVRGTPGNLFMPKGFLNIKDDIYNLKLRPNDVWIITYPKSGTTWVQELVWLLLNDLDYKASAMDSVMSRVPFIEYYGLLTPTFVQNMQKKYTETGRALFSPTVSQLDSMDANKPRLLKSHLPFYVLPPGLVQTNKVIYVARNPKDVLVSYYHHHKLMNHTEFSYDFESFFNAFLADKVKYSPYWPHILDAYSQRNHPNMCFLYFEDLKKKFPDQIRKIARFLQKEISEEDVRDLANFLKFENVKLRWKPFEDELKNSGLFRENESFFRKGEVGDHKNYFTSEMNLKMKHWIEENLTGSDLRFPKHEAN